jgi:3-hydroxypropanoate dehydrogenase
MSHDQNPERAAPKPLDDAGLDLIFRAARTHNAFLPTPVSDETLRAVYDLFKWGPTSVNSSPARVVFVRSKEGKELLAPALSQGNLTKTLAAPVTAIVAHDTRFAEHLGKLFPANPKAPSFFADEEVAKVTAFRNGTLQGAYLIIAARALGLAAGPMSGFDNAKVDAAFFPDGRFRSNFLLNLGYGDPKGVHPRAPRLDFNEACSIR